MTLLAFLASVVLSAESGRALSAPRARGDAPLVLQASAAVFGEVVARGIGAEVGLSLALWRYVDLGLGASIGSSPGAIVTARLHLGWQPDRRVRPFLQLRARYHPLTQGAGGGAQAGILLELGPGRVTLGAAGELFAPVAGYPIGAVMGLAGYELDLLGSHRPPAEILAKAVEEPARAAVPTADPRADAAVPPPGTPAPAIPAPAAVTVTITDLKGKPVAARVGLLVEKSGRFEATQSLEGSTVEFRAAPADYQLEVTAPGFLSRAARFTLAADGRPTLTLELRPAPAVRATGLGEKRIELLQPVQFAPLSDTILASSYPVLDEVVDLLVRSPKVRQVLIVAHTDRAGSAAQNQDLTERQAEAVMRYLIERGVSPARLAGEGAGATRPVAPPNSKAGRRLNRRVTIEILDRAP